jgi:hypothetical protein
VNIEIDQFSTQVVSKTVGAGLHDARFEASRFVHGQLVLDDDRVVGPAGELEFRLRNGSEHPLYEKDYRCQYQAEARENGCRRRVR